MQRITMEDLGHQLKLYTSLLTELGMDNADIQLIEGSKKYGNSFKLVRVDPETDGHSDAPCTRFGGLLGGTKREAYNTMDTINRALSDVSYHLNN